MSASSAIGGIPGLSAVWDHGPLFAAATMFVVVFGIMSLIKWWDWGEFPFNGKRSFYWSYTVNDTVVIPAYMALAAETLSSTTVPAEAFYRQAWWHWMLLALGVFVSMAMVLWEQMTVKRSWDYQRTPSKMWHTLIVPVVFYWLISSYIPMLILGNVWSIAGVLGLTTFWLIITILDGKFSRKGRLPAIRLWIEDVLFPNAATRQYKGWRR